VRIAFGPPVRPEDYADLPPGRARREITDAVMESVAALSGKPRAEGYNDHVPADARRSA
jgi:1-acyl-sn-glycerol-3-phosphate acyltransferase